MKCV
jgi:hypothetical protein